MVRRFYRCNICCLSSFGFQPLFMVNSKSFSSNILKSLSVETSRLSGNDLDERGSATRILWHRLVFRRRSDFHILITKSIDGHADHECHGRCHDHNQWIRRGVAQKSSLEIFVLGKRCRNRWFGGGRKRSKASAGQSGVALHDGTETHGLDLLEQRKIFESFCEILDCEKRMC